MPDVTQLLHALEAGDPRAAEQLLPLVYEQLRKLAAHRLAGEPQEHTLQPTALVHEALLKIASADERIRQGRVAFSPVRNLLAATSETNAVTLYDLDSG